jgi:glycerophosphoryl diester phosphodiesterase
MNKPLIIGHRGASAVAPENTMTAFEAARAAGADGVEFDVRLTMDGIPVVIHDDTLRRTAGLAKRIDKLTMDDLEKVDVGSWFTRSRKLTHEQFSLQTVPRLQQLFDLFSSDNSLLYLEMKCSSSDHVLLAATCCKLVNDNFLKPRVVVESFDLKAIEMVKKIDQTIRTAALFEPAVSTPPIFSERRLVDRAKAVGADEIALHYRLVSNRIVEKAKVAGLNVVVWTVDDAEWIKRAQSIGIDALITNDPAKMLAYRDGM